MTSLSADVIAVGYSDRMLDFVAFKKMGDPKSEQYCVCAVSRKCMGGKLLAELIRQKGVLRMSELPLHPAECS